MARYEVARSEAGEGHELEYGGEVYHLPAFLPLAALDAMADENVMGFLRAVFGSEWPTFAQGFNTQDLGTLADVLGEMYGASLGKSAASGSSSAPTTEN